MNRAVRQLRKVKQDTWSHMSGKETCGARTRRKQKLSFQLFSFNISSQKKNLF